jgi:hypothetical protein
VVGVQAGVGVSRSRDYVLTDRFIHTSRKRMKSESLLMGKAELRDIIEVTLERRRLKNVKTILFVKDVRESLN